MAGIQCYPALEDAMIAALGATVERGRAMRGRAALQGCMVHAPCGWDAGPGRVRLTHVVLFEGRYETVLRQGPTDDARA